MFAGLIRQKVTPAESFSGGTQADADYVAAANPAAILALIAEVRALREDEARLNFAIQTHTTWYPGRAGNGYGVLCYDRLGMRGEAVGLTMRDAIDAARKEKP